MTTVYDLCVVGSGVAGAILAATAAKRGKSVVIVEAGGRFDRAKRFEQLEAYLATDTPWPYVHAGRDRFVDTSTEFEYDLNDTRLKAVGGSTLHWGGTAQRLHPSDFNTRTVYGHGADWPISYDELEKYYTEAERELGVSGEPGASPHPRSAPFPMPPFKDSFSDPVWRRAAARIGASVEKVPYAKNSVFYAGRPPCQAYSTCTICPVGAQYSADVHVAEAEATGRCRVMTHTVARRIEVDHRGRVRAIHCSDLEGRQHAVVAANYVVAAHAIESARLLLLSDVGNQSGHVGRNLMEHFYVNGRATVPHDFFPDRIGYETLQCSSFYDGPERLHRGAIKLELGHGLDPLRAPEASGLWGSALADYEKEKFGHLVRISAETEHLPHPDSRIDLHPTVKDLFGDPVPHIRFVMGEVEATTRARAVEIIGRVLEAADGRDIVTEPAPRWAAHHMGTCRMATSADTGVVDRNLKVFGTANLYAVGSGAFVTGGALQPTLTIAALSLRLADLLTEASPQA